VKLILGDKVKQGKYTAVVSLNLGDDAITVKEVDFDVDSSGNVSVSATRD
jgi:hypothetical protein